jgi:uridine kinase
MNNCIFVGIAGGSGSGKTLISKNIVKELNSEDVVLIQQDAYYKELKNTTMKQREKVNFDHPDSIEFDLLIKHLENLKDNVAIQKPVYDFTTHLRKDEQVTITPKKIIIIEGILILSIPEIRAMLDIKIFVDTDADEMILRRIQRDITQRARTFDSVKDQYLQSVKPMFIKYCEPSKRHADLIVPRGGENTIAINMILTELKKHLKDNTNKN